ncbi:hypothetical protein NESM_000045500 [Novymonas esmeraldas]|uniref:F-box domain-containing protein n=1 Tax=Novymonas esmeraldas TaxID=1808958 RepID=A0AAW0F408_9TRYP
MPTRTEGAEDRKEQRGPEEDVKSPCTPPLQYISGEGGRDGAATENSRAGALEWSPQTPETLPVCVSDVRLAAAAATTTAEAAAAAAAAEIDSARPQDELQCDTASTATATRREESGAVAPVDPNTRPSLSSDGDGAVAETSSRHVDALGDLSSGARKVGPKPLTGGGGVGGGEPASTVPPAHAERTLPPPLSNVFFTSTACDAATAASLVTLISSYCDVVTLVQLMRVDRAAHLVATSDAVWKPLLVSMNLPPLLSAYERDSDHYAFFVEDVITTRALHGHYTFRAANVGAGSCGSASTTSASRSTGQHHTKRDEDSLHEDIFNIASLQLLISAASLGQSNHSIGRVQLLLTYKNDSMEVLQGSCRFSAHRRCFSLCCSAFGTVKRGPVFTVAVATVTKPWANEGFQHFNEHKNGIRLVMTPVLWEGQSPGSQITEKDILVVSRQKPVVLAPAPTADSAAASGSLEAPAAARG